MRTVMHAKIHKATVTEANLNYVGFDYYRRGSARCGGPLGQRKSTGGE